MPTDKIIEIFETRFSEILDVARQLKAVEVQIRGQDQALREAQEAAVEAILATATEIRKRRDGPRCKACSWRVRPRYATVSVLLPSGWENYCSDHLNLAIYGAVARALQESSGMTQLRMQEQQLRAELNQLLR